MICVREAVARARRGGGVSGAAEPLSGPSAQPPVLYSAMDSPSRRRRSATQTERTPTTRPSLGGRPPPERLPPDRRPPAGGAVALAAHAVADAGFSAPTRLLTTLRVRTATRGSCGVSAHAARRRNGPRELGGLGGAPQPFGEEVDVAGQAAALRGNAVEQTDVALAVAVGRLLPRGHVRQNARAAARHAGGGPWRCGRGERAAARVAHAVRPGVVQRVRAPRRPRHISLGYRGARHRVHLRLRRLRGRRFGAHVAPTLPHAAFGAAAAARAPPRPPRVRRRAFAHADLRAYAQWTSDDYDVLPAVPPLGGGGARRLASPRRSRRVDRSTRWMRFSAGWPWAPRSGERESAAAPTRLAQTCQIFY